MREKQKSYVILLMSHSQKDRTIEVENISVSSGANDGVVMAGKCVRLSKGRGDLWVVEMLCVLGMSVSLPVF